MVALYLALLNL